MTWGQPLRRAPLPGERTWKCGHPHTPENTQGTARGTRCRICRRELSRLHAERQRYPEIVIGQDIKGRWAWMLFGPGHKLIASDWNYDCRQDAYAEASARADVVRTIHRETGGDDMAVIAETLPAEERLWEASVAMSSKALLAAIRTHHPDRCETLEAGA